MMSHFSILVLPGDRSGTIIRHLSGAINEFALGARALSDAEIHALTKSSATPHHASRAGFKKLVE
jgi:hypothetical protein